MSKPLRLGLFLFLLLALACGDAPANNPPPAVPVAMVAVAAAPPAERSPREAAEPEPIDDGDPSPVPVTSADPSWGRRDAPVTIVEFAEFQCPFCARAEATLRQLREKYGPDQLRVVWKNNPLPFHLKAQPAAVVAMLVYERTGNGGFWAAHDTFFSEQSRLDEVSADAVRRLGLAPGELEAPSVRRNAEAKVAADLALGKQIGVTGTPAFFINGVFLSGAQPYERFAGIVDEQLDKARALVVLGTPRRRVYTELTRTQKQAAPPPPPPAPSKPPEDPSLVHRVPLGKSPARGKATALVTIVELADFQCPFCDRAATTVQQLQREYGDRLRLVFKENPLPFHVHAAPAAELALEARAQRGDAGFWAAHDLFFKRECVGNPGAPDKASCEAKSGTWLQPQTHLDDADLLVYAKSLGLDVSRVQAAIVGKQHQAVIAEDQQLAAELGATGTPHFFINGRSLVGAQPIERFRALIDEELAKAQAMVKAGVAPGKLYETIMATAPKRPAEPGAKHP